MNQSYCIGMHHVIWKQSNIFRLIKPANAVNFVNGLESYEQESHACSVDLLHHLHVHLILYVLGLYTFWA